MLPLQKITFRIGGLALFVHRTQPGHEGIVVLMPRDHNFFPFLRHRPRVVEVDKNDSKKRRTRGFLEGTYDWRKKVIPGSGLKRVETAAHFSKLTNGGYVPTRMFDTDMPDEAAARFFLPYAPIISNPTPAIDMRSSNGVHMKHKVAGTIDLEYQFDAEFEIPMYHKKEKKLVITTDSAWEVEIANVRSVKIDEKKTYRKGKKVEHVDHYYHLFRGSTEKPDILIDQDYTHPPAAALGGGEVGALYVNPVECIIGTGCAQDDPDCPED